MQSLWQWVSKQPFAMARWQTALACLVVACAAAAAAAAAAVTTTTTTPPPSSGSAGVSSPAASDKHITLPFAPGWLDISNRFYLATDPTTTQTVAEMAGAEFKPLKGVFVAGYSANAHWLKLTISDPAERIREWWLQLDPPFIDQVDFYEATGTDAAGNAQFRQIKTGDMQPFSTREVPSQSFVFQVSPKASPTTYYVRLQSSGPIWVGARLWHSRVFAGHSVGYAHAQAAALGAFLLLMLLTLVQGIVFKAPIYLAFVAHVGAVLVALSSTFFLIYVPDNWYRLVEVLPAVATCLSVVTYAIFCHYFVFSIQKNSVYRWLFLALIVIGVLGAIACIEPAYRWIMPGILVVKVLGSMVPAVAVSRRMLNCSWYERLVWLGLVVYVPAQALLLWRVTSVAPQDVFWSMLNLYTGLLLMHTVLIAFALGERLRRVTRASQQFKDQLATERQLKELADRTAVDQRSFLAMVAHELRGPLAVARSAVYNLRQLVVPQTAAVTTRIERMDTGLQQMASLIAVCLTHEREGFAQPLSLNLQLTLVQLRTRLESCLAPAMAKRVRWPDNLAIGGSLEAPITGNPALLTIAVRNMVENACRYDPGGAPVELVWESKYSKPNQWRISVLDRGPGIPADRMDCLFEPFMRDIDQSDSGLGLGLYIVSRIASMHGAKAQAKPRGGGGAEFSVVFEV